MGKPEVGGQKAEVGIRRRRGRMIFSHGGAEALREMGNLKKDGKAAVYCGKFIDSKRSP